MTHWVIEGGHPLAGRVAVSGAKNVVLKLMISALLAEEPTTLTNVPEVGDMQTAADMLKFLGAKVSHPEKGTLLIDPTTIDQSTLPDTIARKSRASFIFAGPLLARLGEAVLPLPGGDPIGRRPLDRHFQGLQALGAKITQDRQMITVSAKRLKGARYRFDKNTHTGTETLLLAAVRAEGQTILENAAQEPEVDALIALLNGMGARIRRTAPRTVIIDGVDTLHGTEYRIMSDRNEEVSFACMALATKGDLWIDKAQPEFLAAFLEQLRAMGAGIEVQESCIHIWHRKEITPVHVTTAPYPGFMTDWQPLLTTLLTQASGTSTVHETIFERRFAYIEELIKMGAKIEMFNPKITNPQELYNFNWEDSSSNNHHAVRIFGPCRLSGIEVNVTDVRAGATLVQAALTAEKQTRILGIEHIERGYEQLDQRLRNLGAKIQTIETVESSAH